MRKLLVLLSLTFLLSGLTFGQATVLKGEDWLCYGLPAGDYNSFGGTDLDAMFFCINDWLGCDYPIGTIDGVVRTHQVITPSGNDIQNMHGPMVHAIFAMSDFPFCDAEPLAWGWGSLSGNRGFKENKGGWATLKAHATLPDDADMCDGEMLNYVGIVNTKAKGGEVMAKIILNCPKD